jgi:hypothetical protein
MYPSDRDFHIRQEQYKDLLREAERERFIRAAGLQAPGFREVFRSVVNQVWRKLAVRYARPRPAVETLGPCGELCC